MIALQPLGRDQFAQAAHIAVAPEQEPFCGSVARHFDMDEAGCDFHIVTRDGHPVGFFKIDRAYASRFSFARPGELGLRGMMIDRTEQGKGTGTAAMRALAPYLRRHYPRALRVVLTVNLINPAARAIYLAGGFCDQGEVWQGGRMGPQHILRLELRTPKPSESPAESPVASVPASPETPSPARPRPNPPDAKSVDAMPRDPA